MALIFWEHNVYYTFSEYYPLVVLLVFLEFELFENQQTLTCQHLIQIFDDSDKQYFDKSLANKEMST